jgi:hypothetical protein
VTFAAYTKITVDQTRTDIERTLKKYGASKFAYYTEPDRAVIVFEANERRMRFDLPLPAGDTDKEERVKREKWRALLMCIKAKLESIASKIETFEEAFLAHVVMPDGRTVAEHTRPRIASAYESGEVQALLPPPKSR